MESLSDITTKEAAIVNLDNPSPIAYINVFDAGDVWIKTKGCDDCPPESQSICCGNCPLSIEAGCIIHIQDDNKKPFRCVFFPTPSKTFSFCVQEFTCIAGPKTGITRKICEPIQW